MNEIEQQIQEKLDSLIVEFPGQFPNGYEFVTLLEVYLQSLVMDETISEWKLEPLTEDGFKISFTSAGEEGIVLRNNEGGKVE